MNATFSPQFSHDWVAAWNAHDLPAIMQHYADNIRFYSPIIEQMGVNREGMIGDKSQLRAYFDKALQAYPGLHFQLHQTLLGTDSLLLYYTSVNDRKAAEMMQFDAQGRICFVRVHYSPSPSQSLMNVD